jgi:ligand-binding sensor domain-containing protein
VIGNALQRRDGRGDVWLLPENATVGRLAGQVVRVDQQPPDAVHRVRIQAVAPPRCVVHAFTDRAGNFGVDLPVGQYRVGVDQRGFGAGTNGVITVRPGTTANVTLVAPPLTGRVIAAGPGRTRAAGRPVRQGAWLTFGVAEGLPNSRVRALRQDRQGELWAATEGGGVARFDGARFTTYTTEDGLASDSVGAIEEDAQGDLWFSSSSDSGAGVTCLRRGSNQFVTFDSADAPGMDYVGTMAVDRHGSLWLEGGGGLTRWDATRRQFVHHTTRDGLSGILAGPIHAGPSGRLWVGSWVIDRLGEWTDNGLVTHKAPSAIHGCYHVLEDRLGGVWVSGVAPWRSHQSQPVLWRYDTAEKRWARFGTEQGCDGSGVECLYEDSRGQVWAGTSRGLLRYRAGRFENFSTITGLGEETVLAVLEDRDGRMWTGVEGVGLRRFDPAWTTYTTAQGLAGDAVQALAEWRGRLVVSTKRGLSQTSAHEPGHFELMADGEVGALQVDRTDLLWV